MAFPKKRLDGVSKAHTNGNSVLGRKSTDTNGGGCAKLNGDSAFTAEDFDRLRKRTIDFCRKQLKMTDEDAEQFAEIFDSSLQETEAEFQRP